MRTPATFVADLQTGDLRERIRRRVGGLAVYAPHRLDISAGDVLLGFIACLSAFRRRRLVRKVARAFPPHEEALVCLSVRSGLDLLLSASSFTPGSEVLVSAVTHPDMVRIIEGHGLRAVPVDLDPSTLEPRVESLERACSPRTRMILVAHLFGGRFDLGPVAAFARSRDLLLVEDCAQAFRGPSDPGDPLAGVSMFSFGTLKTASAAGGAVVHVRDPHLLERMRRVQEEWPVQSRRHYAGRLLRALGLVIFGRPLAYGSLSLACDLLGWRTEDLVNRAVRAFPTSGGEIEGLLVRLRRRPSAPLLALLARRLRTFAAARLARRAGAGERIAGRLPENAVLPGRLAPVRTHWLFPVIAPDPEVFLLGLRRRGFGASRATSNISAVPAPPDLPRLAPEHSERMMNRLVFVPLYPELPDGALDLLASAVADAAGREK